MFATLLGALPPPAEAGDVESHIETAVRAQEAAGLEPITDGRLRGDLLAMDLEPARVVEAWRMAAGLTDRAVKQALPGPHSLAQSRASDGRAGPTSRGEAIVEAAALVRRAVDALADAGCPMVEIEESGAHRIGADEVERERFRSAHIQLAEGVVATHLSLSIVGGSAWAAGLETITAAPYASLAVDLIDGPDNWNLVTRLAGERGVIAGVLPAKASPADAKETLVWAARYAAGSNGRGLDRVGLGSAGSWANLAWVVAVEKLQRLAEAARVAQLPGGEELARQLDPRAVDARRAAIGHAATGRAATARAARGRLARGRAPESRDDPRHHETEER